MLTMRSPIQLNIGKGLSVVSDSFCQRMQANYGLLSAQYAPKDLLLLMTAPPDLPEDFGGGMTTIAIQQTSTDARKISLDVINNVVNRILLDGSPQFTYQDQVYITSVLQRLGVTNVKQFMAQVRQLRVENESVIRLTALYHEEVTQLLARQAAGESVPPLPLSAPLAEHTDADSTVSERQLYTEIFQRLGTAHIYETIHAFQRSYTVSNSVFRHSEFRLAEQLRVSNALALSELKQQLFTNPSTTLLHHTNHYETGLLLPPPQDESTVLSQATVASLLNAVDRAAVEQLNRPTYQSNQWLHLEHALYQTAENSLARFEDYHSHPASALAAQSGETAQTPLAPLAHYVREFYQFHKLVQQLYPQPDTSLPPSSPQPVPGAPLTHLSPTEEEGDRLSALTARLDEAAQTLPPSSVQSVQELHTFHHLVEQQTAQPDAGLHPTAPQSIPDAPLTYLSQTEKADEAPSAVPSQSGAPTQTPPAPPIHSVQEFHDLQKLVQQQSTQPDAGLPSTAPQPVSDAPLTHLSVTEEGDQLFTRLQQLDTLLTQPELTHLIQTLLRQTLLHSMPPLALPVVPVRSIPPANQSPLPPLRASVDQEGEAPLPPFGRETTSPLLSPSVREPASPPALPPVERVLLTPQEAEESHPELLLQQLTEIDQQNRLLSQQVQQTTLHQHYQLPRPDIQRTLSEALRALEKPEQVLRELYAPSETPTPRQPAVPPEIAAILQQADPATRKLYETVLLYQDNPEAILQQGLLRPGNPAFLNQSVAAADAPSPQEPLSLEHRPADTPSEPVQPADGISAARQESAAAQHPTTPLEVASILKQVDPATRKLYETVLLYQEHPEAILQQGLLRPGNPAFLNQSVIATDAPSPQEPLSLEHRSADAPSEPVQPTDGIPNPSQEPVAKRPPVTPLEVESLLQQVDPATRKLYETVLRHQEPAETILQQELLQPDTPTILRQEAAVTDAPSPSEPISLAHPPKGSPPEPPRSSDWIPELLREATAMRQPAMPPEVTTILQQTDSTTRELQETVLRIQEHPETILQQEFLQAGTTALLQKEIADSAVPPTPESVSLEHPSEASQPAPSQPADWIPELLRELPFQRTAVLERVPTTPPSMHIVHKQAPPDVTEELLERIEAHRTQSVVREESHDTVVQQQVRQTEVTDIQKQVVTQTTEDITALINRTLSKQMRTISDQVYHQMEKKLQAERSRRGRL